MKPYATFRTTIPYEDVHSCCSNATKASAMSLKGKGGDFHGTLRNSKTKRAIRTSMNRVTRQRAKRDLYNVLNG